MKASLKQFDVPLMQFTKLFNAPIEVDRASCRHYVDSENAVTNNKNDSDLMVVAVAFANSHRLERHKLDVRCLVKSAREPDKMGVSFFFVEGSSQPIDDVDRMIGLRVLVKKMRCEFSDQFSESPTRQSIAAEKISGESMSVARARERVLDLVYKSNATTSVEIDESGNRTERRIRAPRAARCCDVISTKDAAEFYIVGSLTEPNFHKSTVLLKPNDGKQSSKLVKIDDNPELRRFVAYAMLNFDQDYEFLIEEVIGEDNRAHQTIKAIFRTREDDRDELNLKAPMFRPPRSTKTIESAKC